MLEFTCPTCGKRMQGEDSSAGQPVQCAACHGMSIASGDAGKGPPSENSFREGEPPYQYDSPLPPVREEARPILMRGCAGGILTGLKFAAIGFGLGFLPLAAFFLIYYPPDDHRTRTLAIFFLAGPMGIGSAFVGGILGFIVGILKAARRQKEEEKPATATK